MTASLGAACSSDNGPSDTSSLAVAVSPTSISIAPGATEAVSVGITRTGSFTGAVTLSATGAPTGVTVAFNPNPIAPGATGSVANVTVGSSVGAGTYSISVGATGDGVAKASATLSVVVVSAGNGAFALQADPAVVTTTPGAAAVTSAITIVRTGSFTGAVRLSVTGPVGVTASVTPETVTGTSATLSIQVAAGAGGTYQLVVRGTATGVADATTIVAVAAGSPIPKVSFTFCPADAPIWVASEEFGRWYRILPTSGSTYDFPFLYGFGPIAIAFVDTVGTGYELNVLYTSAADLTNYAAVASSSGGCEAKTLNGAVANVGAGDYARVNLGYSSGSVFPPATAFQLADVSDGPQDLIASRIDAGTSRVNRIILRRAVNLANNGTIPVLDFGSAEAFVPASANATVSGLVGGETATLASLYTGVRGSTFGVLSSTTATGAAQPYDAVPAAQLGTNEFEELVATSSTAAFDASRSAGIYFRTVADRSLVLGPALSTPTVDATTPYVQPRMSLEMQAPYNRLVSVQWRQDAIGREAIVSITPGYLGTPPVTWDLEVPDLTSGSGWDVKWGLQEGTPITWQVRAMGGAVPMIDATLTDGATTFSATRSSTSPLTLRGSDAFSLQQNLLNALRNQQR